MTLIVQQLPLKRVKFFKSNLQPVMMSKNKFYNPIIGSNLGIPLNLLQYIFCYSHYNENIINN